MTQSKPPQFKAGDRTLSAGALNMMLNLIPRIITGGAGINVARLGDKIVVRLAPVQGAAPGTVAIATITAIHGTYLLCDKDGAEITVAKPWGLRHNVEFPTGGGTIRYVYTAYGRRIATQAGESETQVITPDYEVGEELLVRRLASARINDEGGEPIVWADLNVLGRCWAVEAEVEE